MPTISEVMPNESGETMDTSAETSLQVSSTSPEAAIPSRALQVRKSNTKGSRSGSSSNTSSRSSLPPLMDHSRRPSRDSHRGVGSIVPIQTDVGEVDQGHARSRSQGSSVPSRDHYHQQNLYDQRSVHEGNVHNTQQTLYDQRSINVQVGVDPAHVIQHVQAVESQAQSVVRDAVVHVQETHRQAQQVVHETQMHAQHVVHETQREVSSVVQQAHSHVASVENQAQSMIQELNAKHREELAQAQDAANSVQLQAQTLLQESHDRLQEALTENEVLMTKIKDQGNQLRVQKDEQRELRSFIRDLQSQVQLLQSSALPMPQNGTGVDNAELSKVIAELRRELQIVKQERLTAGPAVFPMTPTVNQMTAHNPFAVETPLSPCSACAGYPPGYSPSHLSQRSNPKVANQGQQKDSTPIELFSMSTPTPIAPGPGSPSGSSPTSSDSGGRGGGGPPSSPTSPPSGGLPSHRSFGAGVSIGIGSNEVGLVESQCYKSKDLALIKIESLPGDAAQFRSWRNGFVTKVCSIDQTGSDVLLTWLQQAFSSAEDGSSLHSSGLFPRLDNHIAAILAEPRHLKSELGMALQSYIEGCQMNGRSPKGRYMLWMLAQQFRLDLQRGANLTEQSLFELNVTSFTYAGLKDFADRIEYILNSIPPDLQPSERTKFTWLFERLKKCRTLQRHIDRIKDSSSTSHRRTFAWLFNKLKTALWELREDSNEEAIRKALQLNDKKPDKDKPKPKAAAATTAEGEQAPDERANPDPKAKAKAKPSSKGDGKGKKGDNSKGPKASPPPKAKPGGPPPKAEPKAQSKVTMPCLFFPKGNCNRGDHCPFSHEVTTVQPKNPKGSPAKASVAKAAVATLIAASASQGADAADLSKPSRSLVDKVLSVILRPFKALMSMFMFTQVSVPELSSATSGCMHLCASPPDQFSNMSGLPVVVQNASHSACLASAQWQEGNTLTLEWIADSGASRSLASIRSLAEQGFSQNMIQQCLVPAPKMTFETGNGSTQSVEQLPVHGNKLGTQQHRILDDCPVARSLGELVSQGHPFVWLPNELPYFAPDAQSLWVRKFVAERVEDHVPIFKEVIQVSKNQYAMPTASVGDGVSIPEEPASVAVDPVSAAVEPPVASEEEEHVGREEELLRESLSLEHRMCHMPKNPFCETCRRARMYKRRTVSVRHDPLRDRGLLPPVDAFGQRLASDFIIVTKSSDGTSESYVQVIRDEYSGFLNAYPGNKHDADTVSRNILAFLGPYYRSTPMIVCKSDNAREFATACDRLGFVHEPTLANRFPHNAVLEREIRTLEEIARAVHVGGGFHIIKDLWKFSVSYAALVFNMFHPIKKEDEPHNRFELATGSKFEGQQLLLGQLVYARKDRLSRHKFDPSAAPSLFAGWRLDAGPKSFKGVCYVLDYEAVRKRAGGYNIAQAVPFEEIYVPDGPPVLPLKNAADQALASFTEPKPDEFKPIEVPFSELATDARPAERHEYITLDRIIKYGGTPSCRACEKFGGKHTPFCKARFDGLVKADKITKPVDPPVPSIASTPVVPEVSAAEVGDVEDQSFSAGIKPGEEWKEALVAKANTQIDDEFLHSNAHRRKYRRLHTLSGCNTIFEYACSESSMLGELSVAIGVECIRLCRSTIDLSDPDQVSQLIEQAAQRPGADCWISLPCTDFTSWQRMNIHRHGAKFERKLEDRREKAKHMFSLAIQFADAVLREGGRVAIEWPAGSGWWDLDEVKAFESHFCFRRVYFHGCMLGVKGKERSIKKPWCISTCDERIIETFKYFQCDNSHEHEPAEGSQTAQTGFYTQAFARAILESWHPKKAFNQVPNLSCANHAYVTKNLSRSEWMRDERGLKAVQDEAAGLRANGTWSDESVTTLSNLKAQARALGIQVKIASLLTLCGIKYWELPQDQWRYKGRIVYRGDLIKDQSDQIVLFEDTATTPTGLTALNITLFYGMLEGHSTSCGDAIQAFLQAPLEEETWIIIGEELWLPSWFETYPRGTKLCVRLLKSLYGHPLAGKLWQSYLTERLQALNAVELDGFPSNFIVPRANNKLLLLNVYVDDLTLSGETSLHEEFWKDLREQIRIEPETYLSADGARILGRTHSLEKTDSGATMFLDMRPYAQGIVEFYCSLCGIETKSLKRVDSPALPESSMSDQEAEEQGVLHTQASKVLMRLLWLSRLTRPDLSFIVGRLASNATRWSRWDDRQLLRVISYLHTTSDFVTRAAVQYNCKPHIHVYTDADFASCPWSAKSTSGIMICIVTGDAKWPVFWQSKKQSSIARSTSESELIAMSSALFGETLQIQDMLHYLLGERPAVLFQQDNQAVIKIVGNQYSVKLRHCGRVHRVNVASVSALMNEEEQCVSLSFCSTHDQLANSLTKIIPPSQWAEALLQLQVTNFPST